MIEKLDASTVNAICEIALNTLRGAIPLPASKRARLAKHKTTLRRIAQKGEGWKKKRLALRQSGGAFLPVLLGTVLSAIFGNVLTG